MPRIVTIGLINAPMTVEPLEQRRQSLLSMIDQAAGCQIVLLPEYADHHRTAESLAAHERGPDAVRATNSLRYDSAWLRAVSHVAKRHRMVVIPCVMLNRGERWTNTAVVYGTDGSIVGEYNKTHLAPDEAAFVDSGRDIAPIDTPFGRLGLLICYDIHFPELTRCHEVQGADILLWSTMRMLGEKELYRTTLPARAGMHRLPLGVATYVEENQDLAIHPMASVLYDGCGAEASPREGRVGVGRGTVDLDIPGGEREFRLAQLKQHRRPELYWPLSH